MKALSMHLLVTVVWTFLHGQTTLGGFTLGAIASYFMLWALQGVLHCESYIRRVRSLFSFFLHFIWNMAKSNFEMAILSLKPGIGQAEGGFTRYPLGDLNQLETALLAQFINLTPGTTVADLDDEGHFILHSFPKVNEEELTKIIDDNLKTRILAITR